MAGQKTEERVRHQVAIAGRVIDGQTHKAIANALVKIMAAPATFRIPPPEFYPPGIDSTFKHPERTRTNTDGVFRFINLPDGDYTLEAFLPEFGTRYGTTNPLIVTVARDNEGNIKTRKIDLILELPPTTLAGQITTKIIKDNQPQTIPVVLAEVRLKDSGEYALSDGKGNYRLTGLEATNKSGIQRIAIVSARGYESISQPVLLYPAGSETTANFQLQ